MEPVLIFFDYLCSLLYFIPLLIIAGVVYDFVRYRTLSRASLRRKHVVVTGASCGIGKSFACEAARRGANVTLVARDMKKLKAAEAEVKKCCNDLSQGISSYSVDVTDSYDAIREAFAEIEKECGPIFMLMNCAGAAVCGVLEEYSAADVKKMLDLNTMGSILPTKAVIEGMKSRGEGHVIFTSSEAAFIGIYGLAPYSASKFALRGFAEALHMEVKYSGVQVTIAFPPDTDTPGFSEEEKTKPKETRLICQSSGLHKPEDVATKILNDALAGCFHSTIGFDGFILTVLNAGMTPESSIFRFTAQVLLMGTLRIVGTFYRLSFYRIIKQCKEERNKSKKAE